MTHRHRFTGEIKGMMKMDLNGLKMNWALYGAAV